MDASKKDCFKCSGTGTFRFAGRIENGKYIGKEGPCFACQGKGHQTEADQKRCASYWRLNIARIAG